MICSISATASDSKLLCRKINIHYKTKVLPKPFVLRGWHVVWLYAHLLSHFYRAALNAGWSSREKGVCLFVKRVNCDKTEEKYVQIFIPYERLFSLG